jgi:hypothetical protein
MRNISFTSTSMIRVAERARTGTRAMQSEETRASAGTVFVSKLRIKGQSLDALGEASFHDVAQNAASSVKMLAMVTFCSGSCNAKPSM